MRKEKFIKIVKQEVAKTPLTIKGCEYAVNAETIGADGISIALTILWLRELKGYKHLIKFLKSEMKKYNEFRSFEIFVGIICKRFYQCKLEQLKKGDCVKVKIPKIKGDKIK